MKILLIAMSGIGDTLIATPLLHELRANYPEAQIDVLVMWAGSRDVLEGNPHLNRVWQKNLIKEGFVSALPYLRQLRRERYDISINAHTQGKVHYRAIARFIGARLRVSHSYENASPLDRCLVHKTLGQDYTVHSIENNNRLLPLVGAAPRLTSHEMELYLTDAERIWAEQYITQKRLKEKKRLGVHVGSGGTKNLALKRWPLDRYIELFHRLVSSHPQLAILLFGGPEEQEAHRRIRTQVPAENVLTPETSNLRQAAALMKHCDAFFSVDTALMHLAAAMKVPNQIVIEAPTLNPTNLPYGNPFKIIPNPGVGGRNLDYYRYDGGPIKGSDEELMALMSSVQVDPVHSALARALA
jgi:ADP-heptose:LPS heptosyltransferase